MRHRGYLFKGKMLSDCMKIDPYKNKQQFINWKDKGALIPDVSKVNEKLIRRFLFDLEEGTNINTSNKKGGRSYIRLNSYRSKLKMLAQQTEKRFNKNFPDLEKQDLNKLIKLFNDGDILRNDGKPYMDIQDYLKTFKAFWHWLQKTYTKELKDITLEAEANKVKAKWVYLDTDGFTNFANSCKPYYKSLAWFCFATGIRVTELKNVRVSDISEDFLELEIREETAKTFGRKIKLMMCSDILKQHIEENNLEGEDIVFFKGVSKTNEYFKRRAKSIFGEKTSKGKEQYKNISILDFRHMSACYWAPRYPTQQGIMYRFGWKKSDKIHYYSEFLGMVDNISEGDLLLDTTKTELQQDNAKLKADMDLIKEDAELSQRQIEEQNKTIERLWKDNKISAEGLVNLGNQVLEIQRLQKAKK